MPKKLRSYLKMIILYCKNFFRGFAISNKLRVLSANPSEPNIPFTIINKATTLGNGTPNMASSLSLFFSGLLTPINGPEQILRPLSILNLLPSTKELFKFFR